VKAENLNFHANAALHPNQPLHVMKGKPTPAPTIAVVLDPAVQIYKVCSGMECPAEYNESVDCEVNSGLCPKDQCTHDCYSSKPLQKFCYNAGSDSCGTEPCTSDTDCNGERKCVSEQSWECGKRECKEANQEVCNGKPCRKSIECEGNATCVSLYTECGIAY